MGNFDIVVIGGGASGLMAAIAAAQEDARVLILEKSERVGKKLLATGNGRCNLSNECINTEHGFHEYYNQEFAKMALITYDYQRIKDEFLRLGLLTEPDSKGWVYPYTRSANSVVNVLLTALKASKVELSCNSEVTSVEQDGQSYALHLVDGSCIKAPIIIAATATGTILRAFKGQEYLPTQAILGPLETDKANLSGLDGLRSNCNITLYRGKQAVCQELGQVQFKKNGLSGIAIFQLSRSAQVGDILSLNFMPQLDRKRISNFLMSLKASNPSISAYESLFGIVHKRLAANLLKVAKIPEDDILDAKGSMRLAEAITDFRFGIRALPNPKDAQVMRGGLATSGFDPKTMESLHFKGLYACGEVLDVDGPCGGFNLHWAWASGIVAGKAAANNKSLQQQKPQTAK